MTSTQVPTVDLAPGMPSRVVTISATDITEGGRSLAGQTVTFALSDSLDVTSGGDVIAKTQATVTLDSTGNGSIRLPVYGNDVKTWCGTDWAILVSASWGSKKAIRIPTGSASVALSALPNIRPLTRREQLWAITSVTASITTGAQWDVDVSFSGGILDFDFTVPPAGEAWAKGILGGTGPYDVFTLDKGVYTISNATAVAATANLPEPFPSVVVVNQNPQSPIKSITVYPHQANYHWETTTASFTTMQPWRKITEVAPFKQGLAPASGVDLFRVPAGVYTFPNATVVENSQNLPEAFPGVALVMTNDASFLTTILYFPYQRDYFWTVTSSGFSGNPPLPTFPDWMKIGGAGSASDLGIAHTVRRATFRRRRGGTIGTGGLPVVALRWDHGLLNFRDKVLPHLIRLGLPGSMAMNSADNRWALPESVGVTPANLNRYATDYGIEVWNHSQTHGGAEDETSLVREIVTGLADLQAKIPSVPIEGFVIPGVPSGNYAGFSAGEDPSRWDTIAGRLILGHHAVSSSHMIGTSGPLSGDQAILGRQFGIDAMNATTVKAEIDDLVASGTGGTILFLHPSQLDGSGMMTTAQYVEVLEYVAAQRNAGKLAVLTMGGMSVADQDRIHRPQSAPLLNSMNAAASLPAGGSTSRVAPFGNRRLWACGAPREIVVTLDVTTAGTVRVATADATTAEYTVGVGRQTIRRPIVIPLAATALEVTVTSGTAAGSVAQILDYPI